MKPGNKLEIESLNDEWQDKDNVLLHACFQLLKDCVEKENLLTGHTDWSADEKHKFAKEELGSLYNWWLVRSKNEASIDSTNEIQYNEENEMLHRLINIRWALWT